MTTSRREEGISEAIGFILILAVVTIALSVFLLYMLPAMGRENEIDQMSAVKEQLTEYKLNIDTLWTSRQSTTAFGPALTLGSGTDTGDPEFLPLPLPPEGRCRPRPQPEGREHHHLVFLLLPHGFRWLYREPVHTHLPDDLECQREPHPPELLYQHLRNRYHKTARDLDRRADMGRLGEHHSPLHLYAAVQPDHRSGNRRPRERNMVG